MYKIHILIFFLLTYLNSYSQLEDSLAADRWINYDRPRGTGDDYFQHMVNKQYVTQGGDTLVRRFFISAVFHQVLKEQSFLHNKQNGLEITYYPNGNIQTIDYYLNGRLWDVVSRADSNEKLQDPGNLHNGNGVRFFSDQYGIEPNCYMTYKNGVPEGPFYWQGTLMTCLHGNLTYKPSVVRYLSGKKVTYANPEGRVTTDVFDTSSYRRLFVSDTSKIVKALSVSDDSLPEEPRTYKYIGLNFDDPAIIPRGTWQVVNTKTEKVLTIVVYDTNGNPIKVTRFKEDGDILSEQNFPSCNKRKW